MKNLFLLIITILISNIYTSLYSQEESEDLGEYMIEDKPDLISGIYDCCNNETLEDISFGYDISAALYAQNLINSAMNRRLDAWLNRQHDVFKDEIENQLNQTFQNYEDARNTYFKDIERRNIYKNIKGIKGQYNNKVPQERHKELKYLRNLKLLKLRKNEILLGNIYNSLYGYLDFNGESLSQITSLNQINTLWINELEIFSNNKWHYHNDKYTLQKLNEINSINNYSHDILSELLSLQLQNYNNYDKWEQLNLMQIYLNHLSFFGPMIIPVELKNYATSNYIEQFAKDNRSGGISLFDPDYYMYHAQNVNIDPWLDPYEALDIAEIEVEEMINEEIDNMLNSVSVDDLKVQSVINNLGYAIGSEEIDWLNDHIEEGVQLFNFLDINNNSLEAKIFAKKAVDILSIPTPLNTSSVSDLRDEILRMAEHLKLWGESEHELFAQYLVEIANDDFYSMTHGEALDLARIAYDQVQNLTLNYLKAIIIPFVDAAYPFIVYAVTEATLGAAIPLISKIPLSMVIRGIKLQRFIRTTTKLGIQGNNPNIRMIYNQTSAAKAESLFAKLTQNAVKVDPPINTPLGQLVKADMGNGNYIIIRYFSSTNPNTYAVIEYNYINLLKTNSFEIKFLP